MTFPLCRQGPRRQPFSCIPHAGPIALFFFPPPFIPQLPSAKLLSLPILVSTTPSHPRHCTHSCVDYPPISHNRPKPEFSLFFSSLPLPVPAPIGDQNKKCPRFPSLLPLFIPRGFSPTPFFVIPPPSPPPPARFRGNQLLCSKRSLSIVTPPCNCPSSGRPSSVVPPPIVGLVYYCVRGFPSFFVYCISPSLVVYFLESPGKTTPKQHDPYPQNYTFPPIFFLLLASAVFLYSVLHNSPFRLGAVTPLDCHGPLSHLDLPFNFRSSGKPSPDFCCSDGKTSFQSHPLSSSPPPWVSVLPPSSAGHPPFLAYWRCAGLCCLF